MEFDVAIVGGGAAGYFTAANIDRSKRVVILEATGKSLSKVKVSGGGRCNVTHSEFDARLFAQNYPRGQRELLSAFSRFQAEDMIAWLSARGVRTKAEKDGRVFPVSNDSATIIQCFEQEVQGRGHLVIKNARVTDIVLQDDCFSLKLRKQDDIHARKVVLATGGDLSGFQLAKDCGLKVISPVPSLFTLNIDDERIASLPGVSFPDVEIRYKIGKRYIRQRGPLLVTHWGFSGPVMLKFSAWAARELFEQDYNGSVILNFLPDANPDSLLNEVWELLQNHKAKQLSNVQQQWLPKRYWQNLIRILFGDSLTCANMSKKQLRKLVEEMCQASFLFKGKSRNKDEFVTAGGVVLKEIDFKTMESRKQNGLYVVGELLDVDGITGGFNFQNAWTTSMICSAAINTGK